MNARRIALAGMLAVVGAAWARPARAQQSQLTPAALGQIADAVFAALVPPDSSLSRLPMARRTLFFDDQRTLALFERRGTPPATLSDLHLRTAVSRGTQTLLEDCAQAAPKPCARLGWGVYTWLEPIAITDTQVVVRANFLWPDRGREQFHQGIPPQGHAFLVGFSSEVFLVRDQRGSWTFSRVGRTAVGDS